MEINSIANSANVSSQSNGINQDDLFEILLTQLQYQDPLEPIDNQEFIAQLAQFTNLEQTRSINDKIDQMLSAQSVNQSVSILGRSVQVQLESTIEFGQVIAVSFNEGIPQLSLKTSDDRVITDVSLSQIEIIN